MQLLVNLNDDEKNLIRELTDSFRKQVCAYSELKDIVQKAISKLVLSRGDMSGLMSTMEQKKLLLNTIQEERRLHNNTIEWWLQKKSAMAITEEVNELNDVLEITGKVIKEFMDGEDQLQLYLERFMAKSAQ